MSRSWTSGYTFYDCGCPIISPPSWDNHGQASEKLLNLLHKLLAHKNGWEDEAYVDFWDDDFDGMF